MSRNRRTGDPERRRRLIGVSLFLLCLAIAIGGGIELLLVRKEKVAGPQAASTTEVARAVQPTNTNPLANFPPLPDDPVELVNIGNKLLEQGDLPIATLVYLEALKKNPEDEEVHFNLGFVYSRQKMTNEAIQQYQECLRILPDYAEAHNNLGNLLVSQRKYHEAIEHFSAAIKSQPEDSSAMNNLGRALAAQGKTLEAIKQFAAAINLNSNYFEAHFNLANAYFVNGSNELADAEYREVLRIKPDSGPVVEATRARLKRSPAPPAP